MFDLKRHLAALVLAFVMGGSGASAMSGWQTNYARAQAQASAEGKLLLVHFTGSDWCGWCIRLQKEVFQKKEFIEYASTNLVLLKVDFPKRKPLPKAQQEFNQALATRFQVEGFPTLLVLNDDGTKLGILGFGEGGPKTFIKELERFVAQKAAAVPDESPGVSKNVRATARGGLQLQGIVAKKGRLTAQINDQSLMAGQSAKVRVASGEVNIRCMEIRDASVIVKVDGRKEPLELKLTQRL